MTKETHDRGEVKLSMSREPFSTDVQEWLEDHCGYVLSPRHSSDLKTPPRNGKDKMPPSSEICGHTTVCATRISDGKSVAIKRISKSEYPHELEISAFLSSKALSSDAANHCLPVIEILQVPGDEDISLLVTPLVRPYHYPEFETIGEVVEFFRQVFEALQYMHEHHVAHRDFSKHNIMMDATEMYPNGSQSHSFGQLKKQSRTFLGLTRHYTRTERPPRYLLVNFSLSRRLDPRYASTLLLPIRGGDNTVPEFQRENYTKPCDPFPTDIYCLGNMIKEEFTDKYFDLEFMFPLVTDMIQNDPSKRPTINRLVSQFQVVLRCLNTSQLRHGLQRRYDQGRWWRVSTHFIRRVRYVLRGIPPVPSPPPRAAEILYRANYRLRQTVKDIYSYRDTVDPKDGMQYLKETQELQKQGDLLIDGGKYLYNSSMMGDVRMHKKKVKAHYDAVQKHTMDSWLQGFDP